MKEGFLLEGTVRKGRAEKHEEQTRELRVEPIYNPLDKIELGESVVRALLSRPVHPLPPSEPFIAAGIYAIYYTGDYPAYQQVSRRNRDGGFEQPIYVGKAIPIGGRRGGAMSPATQSRALFSRLKEHGESVSQAENLNSEDFACRFLAIDDIWIPLAENLLISKYKPLWNVCVDGYGNHDPGAGRDKQKRSSWDVLHPGRAWANKLSAHQLSVDQIHAAIARVLSDEELATKAVEQALRTEDNSGVVQLSPLPLFDTSAHSNR